MTVRDALVALLVGLAVWAGLLWGFDRALDRLWGAAEDAPADLVAPTPEGEAGPVAPRPPRESSARRPAPSPEERPAEAAPALEDGAPQQEQVAPPVPAPGRLTAPAEPPAEPPAEAAAPRPADGDGDAGAGAAPPPLLMPVLGAGKEALRDQFEERRGSRRHGAIDIMAPRGTPVRAVDGGRIVKLFQSVPGGRTVYQFDPTERFLYYYAHLDGYTEGLKEGQAVERGEILGYVGSSGNADAGAPHLHFEVYRLGPEKRWWEGNRQLNPFPHLLRGLEDAAGG